MNAIYRFTLTREYEQGGSTVTESITASPIYKADLAITCARESENKFFRRKLNGTLTFVDTDFAFIDEAPLETYFYVDIEMAADSGKETPSYSHYWRGRFAKSDCTFNGDVGIVYVTPSVYDQYTKVLDNLDTEFDIIKLSPEKEPTDVRKKPLLDVGFIEAFYVNSIAYGALDVTRYQNGEYTEDSVDYSELENNAAITRAGFRGVSCVIFTINIENGTAHQTYDVAGSAAIVSTDVREGSGYYYFRGSSRYMAGNTEYIVQVSLCPIDDPQAVTLRQEVRIMQADSHIIYSYSADVEHGWPVNPFVAVLNPEIGVDGHPTAYIRAFFPLGRWLTDINTSETIEASADDLVGNDAKYKYIHKAGRVISGSAYYDFAEVEFAASTEKSNEATDWGQDLQGRFYVKPEGAYYPLGRDMWREASFWFKIKDAYANTADTLTAHYILPDAFPLSSVLSRLLAEIDANVTHKALAEYSQLLYGSSPWNTSYLHLQLTPKSNLLSLGYTQAAQKGRITLAMLCTMLANTLNAYWFIDADGRFRIEHTRWFYNGGTYNSARQVGTDLTVAKNVRNGKAWAFATSKYKFDKEKIPERITFAWMDDVSADFDGEDIVVLSRMVQPKQTDEHKVGDFTTDVDYMLLHPSDISKDGFALFGSVLLDILPPSAVGTNLIQGSDNYTNKCAIAQGYGDERVRLTFSADAGAQTYIAVAFWFDDSTHDDATRKVAQRITGEYITFDVTIPDGAVGVGLYVNTGMLNGAELVSAQVLGRWMLPEVVMQDVSYGSDRSAQNGHLAMRSLQPMYWKDDMPAQLVKINGQSANVYSVARTKIQELQFPVGMTEPDENKLVRTNIGAGAIQEMNVKLTSRTAEVTLEYEP